MSVGDWDLELAAWRRRVRGCLLGGALGDALGAPFEGLPVVEVHQLWTWVDADRPLRWTDDTALQVALAGYLAGLEQPSAFDDDQLARAFATTWYTEPHRGYGANPPLIFRIVLAGGSWRQAAGSSFGGTGSLGNGGAMRAAPVGALPGGSAQVAEVARRQAAITHAHPLGQDGAALIAVAARQAFTAALDEVDPYAILAGCSTELATATFRDAVDAVAGSLDVADPVQVAAMTGSGIAAHEAAPAALASFLHYPSDPVAAITFAVAMGGDTDTIAAMAGSLAGAASGDGSLPERLLLRLEDRERLTLVADALADRTYSWHIT
jgi:poly(ADP-ribose) glycohydrolase ARH3